MTKSSRISSRNSLRSYLLGTLQGQVQFATYLIIFVGFGVASTGSLYLSTKDLQHHHHMQVERQSGNLKKCISAGLRGPAVRASDITQCLSTFSGWGMLSWAMTSGGQILLPNSSIAGVSQELIEASKKGLCAVGHGASPHSAEHRSASKESSCTLDIQVRQSARQGSSSMHGHGQRGNLPDSIFSITSTAFEPSGLRIFSAEDITLHAGVDSSLLVTLLCLWMGTLIFSVLIVGFAVRRLVSPLNILVEQADMVTAENLSPDIDFSSSRGAPYEIQKLIDSYNNLIRRLSFSWQQQQQFVSAVSHELRTPLSICSGYANRLLRRTDQLSPSQVTSLEAINEEVKRITQLVADLLELSRHDFGTFKLNKSSVNVGKLVHESIDSISSRIPNKLILKMDPQCCDQVVSADFEKLKQVMINLAENASKYSPLDASIQIRVAPMSEGECLISVADSGIGIPSKDLPYVFERFFRSSNVGDISGSGMGLSVVKMMVESMGGRVSIESTESIGTRVDLVFPLLGSNLEG